MKRRRAPIQPQAKGPKEEEGEKTNTSVEKILREIWFDPEDGFGSAKDTLKQAVQRDASITMADVREFFEKQESLQTGRKHNHIAYHHSVKQTKKIS